MVVMGKPVEVKPKSGNLRMPSDRISCILARNAEQNPQNDSKDGQEG